MGHYSKAIGALVGSILGVLAAFNITVPDQYVTLINAALPVIGSVIAVYFAPKNAE